VLYPKTPSGLSLPFPDVHIFNVRSIFPCLWLIDENSSLSCYSVRSVKCPRMQTALFITVISSVRSRVSSGSIVSDYGLDDRAIGVRSLDFPSIFCVQTSSGAHSASCPIGTGVLSPGVKRGRDVTLTTHPYLVPKS
jgi:hypothetical protein